MTPFAKGADVRQAVKPVEGVVADVKYDADRSTFQYLINFTDTQGNPAQRWFDHTELEAA
jgi:hypothetical protein